MRPQPRVENKNHTSIVTTVTPEITRHSPRNGFNGFLRALLGDRAFLSPSPREMYFAKLDASVGASGPHDFAVRLSAFRQAHHLRPSHPASTSVTCARPSVRRDGCAYAADLRAVRSGIFFGAGMDRILPDGQIACESEGEATSVPPIQRGFHPHAWDARVADSCDYLTEK
jgi:hypothetical protein